MDTIESLKAELDVVEGSLGRFARENGSLKRENTKLYKRLRRLENAVREHARNHTCGEDSHCADMIRLVPAKPRPTALQRRKARR